MSCSEDDIINNGIIDDSGINILDGESSTIIKKSVSIFGQWMFNSYSGGGGGNEYGSGGGGEQICNIHSIIFSEDYTFNLYTDNFILIGDYFIDTLNVLYDTTDISFVDTTFVTSSNDTITTIDTIYEVYIEYEKYVSLYIENEKIGGINKPAVNDTTGTLTGEFQFDDFCIEVEEAYYDSVWNVNRVYVPDSVFEAWLIDRGYDDEHDNYVWKIDVENIVSIGPDPPDKCQEVDCSYEDFYDFDNRFEWRIKNLSGIEAFKNIEYMNLVGNKIDSINLTKNISLKVIYANFNEFKSVNTDKNINLENIAIDNNLPDFSEDIENGLIEPWDTITRINFTKNVNLKHISVPFLGLNELDISNNTKLEGLDAINNNISVIDFSSNLGNMENIKLGTNNLSEIDVTNFPNLKVLHIPENKITSLDVSKNPLLEELALSDNPIDGILDVSFMNKMNELRVFNTNISCIQLSEEQLAKYEAGQYERWALGNTPYSIKCN
ncbi:MAG: hypothetical protein CNE34_00470 [Rhodothermaeota bacterium MED-G18]|nr:MAG: hypothetical protein CNE34_00470 [Rhodothermaeota bacterium MED-G18]|tara:strand:- start:4680 stop:6161 length:1482 start_codon:yes stop_codon:yes gene_type:complete